MVSPPRQGGSDPSHVRDQKHGNAGSLHSFRPRISLSDYGFISENFYSSWMSPGYCDHSHIFDDCIAVESTKVATVATKRANC
jgi:hypothetical protein